MDQQQALITRNRTGKPEQKSQLLAVPPDSLEQLAECKRTRPIGIQSEYLSEGAESAFGNPRGRAKTKQQQARNKPPIKLFKSKQQRLADQELNYQRIVVQTLKSIQIQRTRAKDFNLIVISLNNIKIGPSFLPGINTLIQEHSATLEILCLNSCQLQNTNNAPVLPKLKALDLANNQLDDNTDFTSLLNYPELIQLLLENNNIRTLSKIADLRAGLTNMIEIDLSRNPMRISKTQRQKMFSFYPSLKIFNRKDCSGSQVILENQPEGQESIDMFIVEQSEEGSESGITVQQCEQSAQPVKTEVLQSLAEFKRTSLREQNKINQGAHKRVNYRKKQLQRRKINRNAYSKYKRHFSSSSNSSYSPESSDRVSSMQAELGPSVPKRDSMKRQSINHTVPKRGSMKRQSINNTAYQSQGNNLANRSKEIIPSNKPFIIRSDMQSSGHIKNPKIRPNNTQKKQFPVNQFHLQGRSNNRIPQQPDNIITVNRASKHSEAILDTQRLSSRIQSRNRRNQRETSIVNLAFEDNDRSPSILKKRKKQDPVDLVANQEEISREVVRNPPIPRKSTKRVNERVQSSDVISSNSEAGSSVEVVQRKCYNLRDGKRQRSRKLER